MRRITSCILSFAIILQLPSSAFAVLTEFSDYSWEDVCEGGKTKFVMLAPVSAADELHYLKRSLAARTGETIADDHPSLVKLRELRSKYALSGLYKNDGSNKPLWTIRKNWWSQMVYVDSDGIHAAVEGEWCWEPFGYNVVTFIEKGKEIRAITVLDLCDFPPLIYCGLAYLPVHDECSFDLSASQYSVRTDQDSWFVFSVIDGSLVSTNKPLVYWRSYILAGLSLAVIAAPFFVLRKLLRRRHPASMQ